MLPRKIHSDKSLGGCEKKNEKSKSRTIDNLSSGQRSYSEIVPVYLLKISSFGSSLLSHHIIIVIVILNNQKLFFSQLLSFQSVFIFLSGRSDEQFTSFPLRAVLLESYFISTFRKNNSCSEDTIKTRQEKILLYAKTKCQPTINLHVTPTRRSGESMLNNTVFTEQLQSCYLLGEFCLYLVLFANND